MNGEFEILEVCWRMIWRLWWSMVWRVFVYTIAVMVANVFIMSFVFYSLFGFDMQVVRNMGSWIGFFTPIIVSVLALKAIFAIEYKDFRAVLIKKRK